MGYPKHISQCKHLSSEEMMCQNITSSKINHFVEFALNTTKSQGKCLFLLKERAVLHDVTNKRLCIMVRNSSCVDKFCIILLANWGDRGSTVVKVLCYKSEGPWFNSIWCHWNFSLT